MQRRRTAIRSLIAVNIVRLDMDRRLGPLWHAPRSVAGPLLILAKIPILLPGAIHKRLKGMRRREHSEWTRSRRGSPL